jgi:hypothetical protein
MSAAATDGDVVAAAGVAVVEVDVVEAVAAVVDAIIHAAEFEGYFV